MYLTYRQTLSESCQPHPPTYLPYPPGRGKEDPLHDNSVTPVRRAGDGGRAHGRLVDDGAVDGRSSAVGGPQDGLEDGVEEE